MTVSKKATKKKVAKKKVVKKKTTKKKVAKKKTTTRGRPTKFDESQLPFLKYLFEEGKTDQQIADIIGVTKQTVCNWKRAHPDFFDSLKDWKKLADEKVERSLYEKATGYSATETKVFCTKNGVIKTHEVEKHFAPDTTAQIFWLKNRQPDKWRDKREVDLGNKDDETFSFNFNLDKKPRHRDEE